MQDPMFYIRAIHFAATITVAGAVFFLVFIANAAFRRAGVAAPVAAGIRARLAWIAWTGLVLALLSGVAWLVLVARSMSGEMLAQVLRDATLRIVLLQTEFGHDWLVRLGLACALAASMGPLFAARSGNPVPAWLNAIAVLAAAALIGTLVWAGHGAEGQGTEAVIHPAADFMHLIAAAAWVGTLVPLAVLLNAAAADAASVAMARIATARFSASGIGSVAMLLATGSINTWYLAGSIPALADSRYGHLLLTKIALFLGMVAVAATNRLRLAPRLVRGTTVAAIREAMRQLRRNTAIEIAIGAIIIGIVAALGISPPGLHPPG